MKLSKRFRGEKVFVLLYFCISSRLCACCLHFSLHFLLFSWPHLHILNPTGEPTTCCHGNCLSHALPVRWWRLTGQVEEVLCHGWALLFFFSPHWAVFYSHRSRRSSPSPCCLYVGWEAKITCCTVPAVLKKDGAAERKVPPHLMTGSVWWGVLVKALWGVTVALQGPSWCKQTLDY